MNVDDPNEVETYLSAGGSDAILINAMRELLSRYAESVGIAPMPILSASVALAYLQELWTPSLYMYKRFVDSVSHGLVYMIPYLLLRTGGSTVTDDTLATGDALYRAADQGNIEMVDVLLRFGADMQQAMKTALIGDEKRNVVDLLLSKGFLDTCVPKKAHYQRELDWPSYKATGRPMTYMSEMCKRVGSYLTAPTSEQKSVYLSLPVVRYTSLYHQETGKKDFCGTFYYIDAESPVLLDLGRTAVFGSKVHALFILSAALTQIVDNERPDDAEWKEQVMRIKKMGLTKKMEQVYPFNEKMEAMYLIDNITGWRSVYSMIYNKKDRKSGAVLQPFIDNVMKPYYFSILRNEVDAHIVPTLDTTPLYPTDNAKYWSQRSVPIGSHDYLDQNICKMGAELKIDTIILQHEIGEFRVVSEILDTRADTYSHLFRTTTPHLWYTPSDKYPAVWFTDNGFVTDKGMTHDFKIDTSDLNVVKV